MALALENVIYPRLMNSNGRASDPMIIGDVENVVGEWRRVIKKPCNSIIPSDVFGQLVWGGGVGFGGDG